MSKALRASERLVVVPHRPWRNVLIALAALVLVVLSCVAGFLYSAHKLEFWRADLLGQRDNLVEQLLEATATIEAQESRLVTVSTGAKIDREAAEALKLELAQRQRKISELNEDLSFYRNLMNPKEGQTGLDVYRFLVYGLTDTKQLRYRLVLQQLGTSQKFISVAVQVTLEGTIAGEPTRIELKDLVTEQTSWQERLKFRYYHDVEGQFSLPEGFVPIRTEVSLTQTRRAPKLYSFDWEISE